jgi:hypothetical protein
MILKKDFYRKKISIEYIIMEVVKDIDVKKMVDSELLGMYKDLPIYLNFGKYGYYLRYDGKNYSLPAWASPALSLMQAVKIIEYKMKHPNIEAKKEALFLRKEADKIDRFQNYKHAFEHDSE